MENSIGQSGRLNNAQRKALAEIVDRRFDDRIAVAKQSEGELETAIGQELARKFKVSSIDGEIERLKKQIANLEERKTELGFDTRFDGSYRITGGKALALVKERVQSRSLAVRSLTEQRHQAQQAVWLATTIEEAQRVASLAGEEAA